MNSVVGETYEVKNFVVEELDPLPTITDGTKYLECTSNGTIAIPSKQAYGTWEFDLTKQQEQIILMFISDRQNGTYNDMWDILFALIITGVPKFNKIICWKLFKI
jgi:hypothetical protein